MVTLEMRIEICDCGMMWAAPEKWFNDREQDHKTFHCPNGCPRHFPQENEEEKLKRSLRAYKGVITKLKKKRPI